MKRWQFILILILIMSPICVLPLLFPNTGEYAGTLRIGSIQAELYTLDKPDCSCCALLWGGGIATTPENLSAVREGDWATITLLDGTRIVMECAAIIPCIRVGQWLVSPQGVYRAEGEIIVYGEGMAWWFVRM